MNIGTTTRVKKEFYDNYDKTKIKEDMPKIEEQIKTIDEQLKESRGMGAWQR